MIAKNVRLADPVPVVLVLVQEEAAAVVVLVDAAKHVLARDGVWRIGW